VLDASARKITRLLGEDDVVLDVGGWADPMPRADWVMDLMPYETRGLYGGAVDPDAERFGPETWIVRDICAREPFPFDDGEIDFAICSHTLEDIRDPLWVCSELTRVAKAGYIEVPSRLEEQSLGVQGPWAGWSHHRWLIEIEADRIEFAFKSHAINSHESFQLPRGFSRALTPSERVGTLFWSGGFEFSERIFLGPTEHDAYLEDFVREALRERPLARGRDVSGLARLRSRLRR